MAERRGAPTDGGGGWLKAARDYGSARPEGRKELPWTETYPNDYGIMYAKFIINQDGVLKFGREFTERPTRLRGYFNYKTAPINKASTQRADLMGRPDTCIVWCALIDSPT